MKLKPKVDPVDRKVRRVQIDMSEQAYGRLEKLQEVTESASFAEVIRDALRLREIIVKLAEDGHEIFAENKKTGQKVMLIHN